jgi:hypothetical protein
VSLGGKGGKGGKGYYSGGIYYGGKGGKGSKGGYYEFEEECEWVCDDHKPVYHGYDYGKENCYEVCYEANFSGKGGKGGKGGFSYGYSGKEERGPKEDTMNTKKNANGYATIINLCTQRTHPNGDTKAMKNTVTMSVTKLIGGKRGKEGKGYYGSGFYYGCKGGKGSKGGNYEYEEECEWICDETHMAPYYY